MNPPVLIVSDNSIIPNQMVFMLFLCQLLLNFQGAYALIQVRSLSKEIKSTYLYGGALDEEGNNICSGKFTSDHTFDPDAVDDQPGIFLLLNSILE